MTDVFDPPDPDTAWRDLPPPELEDWDSSPRWGMIGIITASAAILFIVVAILATQTTLFGGTPKDAALEARLEVSCSVENGVVEYVFAPVVDNPHNLEIVAVSHDLSGLPELPATLRVDYIDGSGNAAVAEDSTFAPNPSTCDGGGLTA